MTDYAECQTLDAAVARCRLPIKVVYHEDLDFFFVARGLLTMGKRSTAEARTAYLALVESMEAPE